MYSFFVREFKKRSLFDRFPRASIVILTVTSVSIYFSRWIYEAVQSGRRPPTSERILKEQAYNEHAERSILRPIKYSRFLYSKYWLGEEPEALPTMEERRMKLAREGMPKMKD